MHDNDNLSLPSAFVSICSRNFQSSDLFFYLFILYPDVQPPPHFVSLNSLRRSSSDGSTRVIQSRAHETRKAYLHREAILIFMPLYISNRYHKQSLIKKIIAVFIISVVPFIGRARSTAIERRVSYRIDFIRNLPLTAT